MDMYHCCDGDVLYDEKLCQNRVTASVDVWGFVFLHNDIAQLHRFMGVEIMV
jgi:hypothetical protein